MHFPPPARARRRTVVCLTVLRKEKRNELKSSAGLKFQFESRYIFFVRLLAPIGRRIFEFFSGKIRRI